MLTHAVSSSLTLIPFGSVFRRPTDEMTPKDTTQEFPQSNQIHSFLRVSLGERSGLGRIMVRDACPGAAYLPRLFKAIREAQHVRCQHVMECNGRRRKLPEKMVHQR